MSSHIARRPYKFKVAQSSQYPVDLYFLLDLSWSMNKSRNHIAEMGGDIIAAIKGSIYTRCTYFNDIL